MMLNIIIISFFYVIEYLLVCNLFKRHEQKLSLKKKFTLQKVTTGNNPVATFKKNINI